MDELISVPGLEASDETAYRSDLIPLLQRLQLFAYCLCDLLPLEVGVYLLNLIVVNVVGLLRRRCILYQWISLNKENVEPRLLNATHKKAPHDALYTAAKSQSILGVSLNSFYFASLTNQHCLHVFLHGQ